MNTGDSHTIKIVGVGDVGYDTISYISKYLIVDQQEHVSNVKAFFVSSTGVPVVALGSDISVGRHIEIKGGAENREVLTSDQELTDSLCRATAIMFIVVEADRREAMGAASFITQAARSVGVITIGIVVAQSDLIENSAKDDTKKLLSLSDSLIVLLRDKLLSRAPTSNTKGAYIGQLSNFTFKTGYALMDSLTTRAEVNISIADVRKVLGKAGMAVVGTAVTTGERRALTAAQQVTSIALQQKDNIQGARRVLLSIMTGVEAGLEIEELSLITDYIQERAGVNGEIIFGYGTRTDLKGSISLTLIATDFSPL
ncbi:hypothetical protein ACSX1A_04010 [Pontibacter sp. MBLB2868]|uniref:hypothetical protein n=1 Tax=Pontibacter sp. MBLB2868 TaxID=3451555 RepID=UPI003F75117F